MSDHVIVGGTPQFYKSLIDDLEARGLPSLIVESDGDTAERLYTEDENVIAGESSSSETLENANAGDARAAVPDVTAIDGIGTTLSGRSRRSAGRR
jgi:Trk K+ transport system NAD-binding subunit